MLTFDASLHALSVNFTVVGVQLLNAVGLIVAGFPSNVMVVRLLQLFKRPVHIWVTELGIVIRVRFEQPSNNASARIETLFDIVTLVRLVQY